MEQIFRTVANMSVTASFAILLVFLLRLVLKKAPRIFSYCLWTVVLFRLVCPVSFSSALSFFSVFQSEALKPLPVNPGYSFQQQAPAAVNSSYDWANSPLSGSAPAGTVHAGWNVMEILSLLWVLGVIALLTYSIISYVRLCRRVSCAARISDNIFECENITSPFVLGVWKPRIYLPLGLAENERGYVILHERTHIRRFDYLIKPLTFLVLCIHWFNPLVWLAFVLLNRDMEMSCDERVLKITGTGIKKDYSTSLLALAVGRKMITGSPLAFGESGVKGRIQNVLNYRKPAFWVVAGAIVLVVAASIGLMMNPRNSKGDATVFDIHKTAVDARQQQQLLLRARRGESGGGTFISGAEFGKFLEEASVNWSRTTIPPSKLVLQDLTIYINIGSGYEVNFFASDPELARVQLEGKSYYFKVPGDTFSKLFAMYAIRNYAFPEETMKAIADGKRTKLKSVSDVPVNVAYKVLRVGNDNYYLYKRYGKCYVEKPYQFINEITEPIYEGAVKFALPPAEEENKVNVEMKNLVEDNIAKMVATPSNSDDPGEHITENNMAYEEILKYGGETSLVYMLSEFKSGNVKNDLRGQIMMRLCIALLGERCNVTDTTLPPTKWYSMLSVRPKVDLPDYEYDGNDLTLKLVYETELEKNKGGSGFTVVAPHIFGSYEEGNKLKVFATTYISHYILFDKVVKEGGGSLGPAAITYVKNAGGDYVLENYQQAQDGSRFGPSIKEFCVLPESGKKISGLADQILKYEGKHKDIIDLQRENLIKHLKKYGKNGVYISEPDYPNIDKLVPLT